MSVLAQQETLLTVLVEEARTKPTGELRALYRQGLDLADGNPALVPWHDAMDAVRVVLRERIAADWLHANWCPVIVCPAPEEHLGSVADAAREIAAAYVSGASLADAVYRGMWPHDEPTARGTAELSRNEAFRGLIADLVSVVPSEVTA